MTSNEIEAFTLYLILFPQSRAQGKFRFYHNTGCRKNMQCVFCRECGPTWASRWPKTARAKRWEREHLCDPLRGVLEQAFEAYT